MNDMLDYMTDDIESHATLEDVIEVLDNWETFQSTLKSRLIKVRDDLQEVADEATDTQDE